MTVEWRAVALVGLLAPTAVACLPTDRLNSECAWTGDHSAPLDLARPDDVAHLRRDVLIAEELGVRHADATVRPPRVAAREACIARLADDIGARHAVSHDVVVAQRGWRDWRIDSAFLLIAALAYGWVAYQVVGWVRRRFTASRSARLVVVAGAALAIALLAVGVGEFASMIAEGARVANLGHMSGFRGARIPWKHHRGELAVGAMCLFWLVAFVHARTREVATDS